MGGGLMQLVAYGAQDIYLTGNPQITFFKVVYRRHTNFSMETIQQTINGASTTDGGSGTVTISRNGDLVHKVYVTSSTSGITDGDDIISEVELEIGGQRIDRHYKEWNQIWNELTIPESKSLAFKNMTGSLSHGSSSTQTAGVNMVQVPLNFWFCRNPGLALPLIALQYHEVKLKFTWGSSTGTTATCSVFCDYIYLDTDERRRFAQVSHEYLIEQLQREEKTISDTTHKLNFNHPVKELIWTGDGYVNAQIKLNGHDRFAVQEEEYFQLRQPFDYHTSVPGTNIPMEDRPVMLSSVLQTGVFQLQALSGNDTTVLTTVLGTDGDAAFGILGSLTADAAVVETTAAAKKTLIIREATPDHVFKAGDIVEMRINDANGSQQVEIFSVISVRSTTAIVADKTFQELTLDRDPLAKHVPAGTATTLADGDDLIITIIARIQDPLSRCSQFSKKINVYSFALKPEEHQPSGTCNFSRIDNAELKFSIASPTEAVTVYAVNYNVLRIMSGMGGLAYSN